MGLGRPARVPWLLAAAVLAAPAGGWAQRPTAPAAADSSVVIYLVRHAEKVDESRDPPLNAAGRRRALELARVLGGAGIGHVWSTDYRRTRATVAPIAERLGLPVEPYDPGEPARFAASLLATPGRHLVVGHSNTVPLLVRALGGWGGEGGDDPAGEIGGGEYDRLYLVVLSHGAVTAMLLRYGGR